MPVEQSGKERAKGSRDLGSLAKAGDVNEGSLLECLGCGVRGDHLLNVRQARLLESASHQSYGRQSLLRPMIVLHEVVKVEVFPVFVFKEPTTFFRFDRPRS